MSDDELVAIIKNTNKQLDVLKVLNSTFADDDKTKEHLERIRTKKKNAILDNVKILVRERPSLYKKCFSNQLYSLLNIDRGLNALNRK